MVIANVVVAVMCASEDIVVATGASACVTLIASCPSPQGRAESVIVVAVVAVIQVNLINAPCCWSALLGCAQWVNRLLFGLVL